MTAGPRAVAVLHLTDHRDGTLGPHHETTPSLLVHSPLRPHAADLWRDLLRAPVLRHAGLHLLATAVTDPETHTTAAPDEAVPLLTLTGRPGPRLRPPGLRRSTATRVLYSHADGGLLRSVLQSTGPVNTHPAPRILLTLAGSDHPLSALLRALSLSAVRPFLCQTAPSARLLHHPPVPLTAAPAPGTRRTTEPR